jgi:hypothetical protein
MKKLYFLLLILSLIILMIGLQSCIKSTNIQEQTPDNQNPASTPKEELSNIPTPTLISPKDYQIFEADSRVSLKWEVSPDTRYDLYFGQDKLSLYASNLTYGVMPVPTEPHNSYMWKVVAKNGKGGKPSEIRHFIVKCRGWR